MYPVRGLAPRKVMKSPLSCTVMADIMFEGVSFTIGAGERPLAGVTDVEVDAEVDGVDVEVARLPFFLLPFRLFRLLLLRCLLIRKSNLWMYNLL